MKRKIIQVIPVKETLYEVLKNEVNGSYAAHPIHYLGLSEDGYLIPLSFVDGYCDMDMQEIEVYHYYQLKEFPGIEILDESNQVVKEREQVTDHERRYNHITG